MISTKYRNNNKFIQEIIHGNHEWKLFHFLFAGAWNKNQKILLHVIQRIVVMVTSKSEVHLIWYFGTCPNMPCRLFLGFPQLYFSRYIQAQNIWISILYTLHGGNPEMCQTASITVVADGLVPNWPQAISYHFTYSNVTTVSSESYQYMPYNHKTSCVLERSNATKQATNITSFQNYLIPDYVIVIKYTPTRESDKRSS